MNENEEDPMDEKSLQKEIGKEYKYAKFHIDYSYDKNEFSFFDMETDVVQRRGSGTGIWLVYIFQNDHTNP